MVNRAGWLGVNLPQFALIDAVRHDGLGSVLAGFELRTQLLLWLVWLFLPDLDVLVAWNGLLPSGCCLYVVLIWTSSGLAATFALTLRPVWQRSNSGR